MRIKCEVPGCLADALDPLKKKCGLHEGWTKSTCAASDCEEIFFRKRGPGRKKMFHKSSCKERQRYKEAKSSPGETKKTLIKKRETVQTLLDALDKKIGEL